MPLTGDWQLFFLTLCSHWHAFPVRSLLLPQAVFQGRLTSFPLFPPPKRQKNEWSLYFITWVPFPPIHTKHPAAFLMDCGDILRSLERTDHLRTYRHVQQRRVLGGKALTDCWTSSGLAKSTCLSLDFQGMKSGLNLSQDFIFGWFMKPLSEELPLLSCLNSEDFKSPSVFPASASSLVKAALLVPRPPV